MKLSTDRISDHFVELLITCQTFQTLCFLVLSYYFQLYLAQNLVPDSFILNQMLRVDVCVSPQTFAFLVNSQSSFLLSQFPWFLVTALLILSQLFSQYSSLLPTPSPYIFVVITNVFLNGCQVWDAEHLKLTSATSMTSVFPQSQPCTLFHCVKSLREGTLYLISQIRLTNCYGTVLMGPLIIQGGISAFPIVSTKSKSEPPSSASK